MNIKIFDYDITYDESNNEFFLKHIIECDCHCHSINLVCDNFTTDMSFWQYGHNSSKFSWKHRILTIWYILVKGHCYSDMVTLKNEKFKDIYKFSLVGLILQTVLNNANNDSIDKYYRKIYDLNLEASNNKAKALEALAEAIETKLVI